MSKASTANGSSMVVSASEVVEGCGGRSTSQTKEANGGAGEAQGHFPATCEPTCGAGDRDDQPNSSRVTKRISPESCTSTIGLITLDEKQTGERHAGNPHATFDAAGAETQLTIRLRTP
jgi:hypothetical protein